MPVSRTTGILIVLAILVLGAAAYLLLRPSTESGVSAAGAPASAAELTFINLTAKINPVSFDSAILTDLRFIGLVDIRTAILPEPSGRQDPFGPFVGVTR